MKKPFGEFWKGPIPVRREQVLQTSTLADAKPADNAMTMEKLLKAMKDLPPAPPPVTELRCNPRMIPDARRAGFPVVVSDMVPDGYIVVMKRGQFGPEVAGIIGPEKKTDLDASK